MCGTLIINLYCLQMKKWTLFLLLFSVLTFAQSIDKAIKFKVAMVQNCVQKGAGGETFFWQSKGKITFSIVNYTAEQNPIFKELFIKQYNEIAPIYQLMNKTEQESDTALFIKILIKQEEEYRNLLSKEQLQLYLNKMADLETNNPTEFDSYSALFFSDKLLIKFKQGFL